jgi:hypothetical protein
LAPQNFFVRAFYAFLMVSAANSALGGNLYLDSEPGAAKDVGSA